MTSSRKPRGLTGEETAYITSLLDKTANERLVTALQELRVEPLDDGGMGSLRFVSDRTGRVRFRSLASDEFEDSDGVPVSVELTCDQFGNLFELDIFKADFSPLRRLPEG